MAHSFFEQPILNTPYEAPTRHHALDPESGRPLEQPPVEGRRRSELISPVPPSKKQSRKRREAELDFGLTDEEDKQQQEYTFALINEIRAAVTSWRNLPDSADWGVTPTTKRLLLYWRHHNFERVRPFFCQIEAVETAMLEAFIISTGSSANPRCVLTRHFAGASEVFIRQRYRTCAKWCD